MTRRAKPEPRKTLLEVGDRVVLGHASGDPVHWWIAEVLWTDWREVLVHQEGWCGQNPHNALHPHELVRAFGDLKHCSAEKRKAEQAARDAAGLVHECEEQAKELRRKLMDVFDVLAADALKSSITAREAARTSTSGPA